MKDVIIPKQETKTKKLFVPFTPSEHKKIKHYCNNKKVKLTDLIRHALKKTYGL